MNLLELKKSAREGKLPVNLNTAYKWHSLKKYPKLIVKVANKLFFDLSEWEDMFRKSRLKQEQEAKNLRLLEV